MLRRDDSHLNDMMPSPDVTSPEVSPDERWIDATYRVQGSAGAIEARALAIALEQSIEAPVQAVTDARVMQEVVGRVAAIVQVAPELFNVTIRLSVETTGLEAGQLLNMLFGNSSLQEDVALADADFPSGFAAHFGGPRHGVSGIRALTGVYGRPLTCTALKPQGLSSTQLAALARTFAQAGVDVIKDDHGLANQVAAPFAERVHDVQRAIDSVNRETGRRTAYAPSLTGNLEEIRAQVAQARQMGVGMLLVTPMVSAVSTLATLAREAGMPILAHPALAGASRIAPSLLLGKLFRLFGADAAIFPNAGGRFSYTPETCAAIALAARGSWHGLAPTLPVPAGGMSVERVPEMRAIYGDDTMLLIGGSLLAARDRLLERSQEFVAAVHASVPSQ